MKRESTLEVRIGDRCVGTLAMTAGKMVAFAYSEEWLEAGYSVSPFSLPLERCVFVPQKWIFDGLFGAFADSLPDAWGRLLLSRMLSGRGISEDQLGILDRLAIVGDGGMGALCYHPARDPVQSVEAEDLDELARECQSVLSMQYDGEVLDRLYRLGGTSGGARPKILTTLGGEELLIKFPARFDYENAGQMEYDYMQCARDCGMNVPDCYLLPSAVCSGYFGVRRFDRDGRGGRIHMLSAAALLEIDYRTPSLDYHTLMKLTAILTCSNQRELRELYRRMCFNVFAHNRDDHARNFSFLYNEKDDIWTLSPAYDLTYSNTAFGEHTTTVDGNGLNPDLPELIAVGRAAGLRERWCEETAKEIWEKTRPLIAERL